VRSSLPITPSCRSFPRPPATLAAEAGSQPRAAGPYLRLGVEDLLVGHFPDHAAATVERPATPSIGSPAGLISMALAIVAARMCSASRPA